MNIIALSPVYGRPAQYYNEKLRYLQKYLPQDVNVRYCSIPSGLPSIESEYHAAVNSSQILQQIEKIQTEKCWDGIFIDCFDDPAVTAAREICSLPVLGPYNASVKTASLISNDIGIITTDAYGISCERKKASSYGHSGYIRKIIPIEARVLSFSSIYLSDKIVELSLEFEKEAVYTVILGCTGMFFQAEEAQYKLHKLGSHVQIIEPLRTGLLNLISLIRAEYKTSMTYATY